MDTKGREFALDKTFLMFNIGKTFDMYGIGINVIICKHRSIGLEKI